MPRKRSRFELSIHSLLLSVAVLSGATYASGYYPPSQQVPIIPPQVPLKGAEATPDIHEFVRCPTQLVSRWMTYNNRL
jgi:lipase ATG15